MPVLKFICPKCNHIYEELVRVGQTAPCPKCGETHVERYYQGKCSFGMLGSSAGYTTTTRGHAGLEILLTHFQPPVSH